MTMLAVAPPRIAVLFARLLDERGDRAAAMKLATGSVGVGEKQYSRAIQPRRHLLGEFGGRPRLPTASSGFDHYQWGIGVKNIVDRGAHGAVAFSICIKNASTWSIKAGLDVTDSSLSPRRYPPS